MVDELINSGDPLSGAIDAALPRPVSPASQPSTPDCSALPDRSAAALLGSPARITLLRALIRDASGGVRRPQVRWSPPRACRPGARGTRFAASPRADLSNGAAGRVGAGWCGYATGR